MLLLQTLNRAQWVALLGLLIFWPWLLFFLLTQDRSNDIFDTMETVEDLSSYTEERFGYTLPTDASLLTETTFKCDPKAVNVSEESGIEYRVYCVSGKDGGVSIALGEMSTSLQHDEYLPKEVERIVEREDGGINTYSCTNDLAYTTLNDLPGGITDCEIALMDGSTIYASMYFFGFKRTDEISHILSVYVDGTVGNADVVKERLRSTIPSIKGVLATETDSDPSNP